MTQWRYFTRNSFCILFPGEGISFCILFSGEGIMKPMARKPDVALLMTACGLFDILLTRLLRMKFL